MRDVENGHGVPGSVAELNDSEAACTQLWSVYVSEAERYDKALVESWRVNMDGMLIFAGLFSASLTAFIIESYKTLTPDSGDTTAALLAQISKQLAASASGETFQVPVPAVFVIPVASVICNTLWFISIGLSLVCALIATLVEQWAREFVQKAEMRPSPVIRARIFSYLYYGLKRFNMHVVVDLVPLLLHMSLVLFFAGLVAFLLPINHIVMAVAAALLGIVVTLYCTLTVLPLLYLDCPYRTPFSTVIWRIRQVWFHMASRLAGKRHDRPENSKLFAYHPTLEILLRGLLLPPSVQQMENYLSLLHMGTSRLPMTLHGTDILISYISAHISDPELWFVVNSWSRKCDYAQLWKAIMAYLGAGCTGSNNTEATLEVICKLYHWLCWALSGDRLDWDVLLPWFDESDLSTLQSLPVSHATVLASVIGMIKVRIWLSLVYRHKKICERLEKGDIMRVTTEFRGNLAAKLHLTSRDPYQELAIIPMFPTNSQNMDLTQGDWDESHSFLSHPFLSESSLGKVSDSTDPNFGFGACDDNLERAAHYLNLLDIISRRFSDAMVVFYAEFLEACSSETLPYLARRTLECIEIRGFSVFSANGKHQIRFANSVHAFMKARATSSDHTQLWERFILRSSILEYSLKKGTPYFRMIRAQDTEPVAAEILRNSLNEYADSIKGSPDTGLELAVQKILDNLEGFSKTPPASIK